MERKISKEEDAIAIWFKLDYADVDLYSLTVEDAYRTPTAQIVTKEELDKILERW